MENSNVYVSIYVLGVELFEMWFENPLLPNLVVYFV